MATKQISFLALAFLLSALVEGCAGPLGLPPVLGPSEDVAVVILLFGGICFVVRKVLVDQQLIRGSRTTASDIVKDRYARGEINSEEFHRMLDTLEKRKS